MTRLAHLSDIHLSAPVLEWQVRDWFNKRLAAWVNYRWLGRRRRFRHADEVLKVLMAELRERKPDRIIFSGDATALGFAAEIRRAAEILGVHDGFCPGLAVPGNHDYCTRPAAASGNFERYFAPWQQGERIGQHTYPFAQRAGPAWLVAVNTSTGNRWAWDAGGAAGPQQRERLSQLLERLEPGPRILVTHFPICLASGKPEPRHHGLRDLSELVQAAAAGGVSLWLHGHRHSPYFLNEPPLAPFPVICAGSATQTGLWTYAQYELDGLRFRARQRVYDPEVDLFHDGDFHELTLRPA